MEDTGDMPSKKKVFLPIAIILVLIVVVLMIIKASVNKETRLNSQQIEMVEGAEVPNFQLIGLDGSKKNLSDLPHKVMLINFWATWCEACMEEMPSMVALRDQYAPKGFEIIGINVDESPAQVVPQVVSKMKIKFPIFSDPGNVLAELFDVHAIPLSVMIDKDHKILMIESGGREWNDNDVHQMLDKWLK